MKAIKGDFIFFLIKLEAIVQFGTYFFLCIDSGYKESQYIHADTTIFKIDN